MVDTLFKKVIIIGYGTIAYHVLKYCHEVSSQYDYNLEYIEHEEYAFNIAKKYAIANQISYRKIEEKSHLLEYFLDITKEKVLMISANNNYLFPSSLLNKKEVTVINFHNALLPEYPGRNAPSWIIFEKQRETGITWHYVTEKVDSGDIIIQKSCNISENIKAYELVAQLMDLGFKAFVECLDDILQEKVLVKKQLISNSRKLYKSFEIPNGGRFCLTDSPKDIYRLLRAMDYGKNDIFPLPVTELDGQSIRVRRYSIVPSGTERKSENMISLVYDEKYSLVMKYDVIYSDGKIGGG